MRLFVAPFLAISLLVVPVTAQMEMPKPAPELEAYSGLLGYFEGSGVMKESADSEEGKWTCTVHAQKVLDGFFIREDTTITADGAPTPMVFRSFYGWDRENKRYHAMSADNMGEVATMMIHWADKKTMRTGKAHVIKGKMMCDRWTTVFGDGGYKIHGERAIEGGAFFTHVKGTLTKVDAPKATTKATDAAAFMVKPNDKMVRLKPLLGKYRYKGKITMPTMPEMEITGASEGRMIFGGTMLETIVKGEGTDDFPGYKGYGIMAWSETEKRYKGIFLDNMGDAAADDSRWVSAGKLVSTMSRSYAGQLMLQRSIIACKDGKLSTMVTHTIMGAEDPLKTFELTYEK